MLRTRLQPSPLRKSFVYEEEINNFYNTELLPDKPCDLYVEKSPIFGLKSQLSLYTDEYLKKLFTDVHKTPAIEKIMVACLFVSDKRERSYTTYTLDSFRENISPFM